MSNSVDTERVSEFLRVMYRSYLNGDTVSIDRCLSGDFSMFDSARWELVQGHGELAELRTGRTPPSSGWPRDISLDVTDLVVSRWGDVLIAAYLLKIAREGAPGMRLPDIEERTTAVLFDGSGPMELVHIHEQPR